MQPTNSISVKVGDRVAWNGKAGTVEGGRVVRRDDGSFFVVTDPVQGRGVPLNHVVTSQSFRVCGPSA